MAWHERARIRVGVRIKKVDFSFQTSYSFPCAWVLDAQYLHFPSTDRLQYRHQQQHTAGNETSKPDIVMSKHLLDCKA